MRNTAFLVLALSLSLQAQTKIDLAKQATNADFSAFSATRPAKVGTSLPTCTGSGWLYFKSDATAGRNLYGCVGGVWYQLGGSPSVAWGDITGVPSTFAPSAHASSHLSGGGDALTLTLAEFASGSKTGTGSRAVTASGVPASGCGEIDANGNLVSTGSPCVTGGGTTSSVAGATQSFAAQTSVTVTHNFNSLNQVVACYDGSAQQVFPNTFTAGLTSSTVTFTPAQTGSCTVLGGTGLYSQAFTAQTSVSLTHSLGTQAIIVACYDGSNQQVVPNTVTATSTSAATVTFTTAQTGSCVVASSLALTGGGGGSGTVTSVTVNGPTGISATGNPVTGAGTIALSWDSQTAGKVLASPAAATGAPSFRVLAQSDIPAMTGDSGSGGVKGAVPAPAAGDAAAGKYLKADGTWAVPPGGGGGTTYTAGDGISIASSVISVDATVPAIAVSGSQSLTFGTINQSSCSVQTITATGAAIGDRVVPGYPATLPDGLVGLMHVTATNTVSVRLCKITAGSADVTGLTFTYQIIRAR